MLAACDLQDDVARTLIGSNPVPTPFLENSGEVDVLDDAIEAAEQSDCRRLLRRSDGSFVCIDALLQEILGTQPLDNDGDGIPNISDDDIDGDRIPNGFDLDTDGDGVPNSIDNDIDGDGVPNEDDVDIDGDFLRNRWDPDIDGDLIYNPRDDDADADGRIKAAPIVNFACGPVDLFNDPSACGEPDGEDCDSDSNDNTATGDNAGTARARVATATTIAEGGNIGATEEDCEDNGRDDNAMPGEAGRNAPMTDIIVADVLVNVQPQPITISQAELPTLEQVLAPLVPNVEETLEALRDADENLDETDYADAIIRIVTEAVDPDAEYNGGGLTHGLGDDEMMAYLERRDATIRLAQLPDVDVSEAVNITGRFNAAVTALSASLANLVDTTVEIDAHFLDTPIRADGAMAVSFVAAAEAAEFDAADVPAAIPSTARTLTTIGNQTTADAVWQIVVDQASGFQNEDDSFAFSLVDVSRLVENVAGVLDDPNLEAVSDSVGAVLDATGASDLENPLAVFEQLVETANNDPMVSLSDGISTAEATEAAEEVANS